MKTILSFFILLAFSVFAKEQTDSLRAMNEAKLSNPSSIHTLSKQLKNIKDPFIKEYATYLTVLGLQKQGGLAYFTAKENAKKYSNRPDYKLIAIDKNKEKEAQERNFNLLKHRLNVCIQREEMTAKGFVFYNWKWVTPAQKTAMVAEVQKRAKEIAAQQREAKRELEQQRRKQAAAERKKEQGERHVIDQNTTCSLCGGTGRHLVKASLPCSECRGTGKGRSKK